MHKVVINTIEYKILCNGVLKDLLWYDLNNIFHREIGPAKKYSDGYTEYIINGKLHREDGPARILVSGHEEFWLNGKYYPDVNSPEELLIASIIE